ncbi:MAG TPA: sulfotransferase [Rudaea sp.]|nr:sulfotransferase [Rudaea sp.]
MLRIAPQHREAAFSLAYMLREQGRMQAAAEAVIGCLLARSDNADDTVAALIFLRECGAHGRALPIAQTGVSRWPDNAEIAALAGEFALAIGEFRYARQYLRATLELDAGKSASWLRLAYCQHFAHRNDADFGRIERAWNDCGFDPRSRMCAGFALAKALDDLCDYEHAAKVMREANAMAKATLQGRDANWSEFLERRINERPLPQMDVAGDFAPIFIVGLPRTGTTLTATILSRNHDVRDRGELNWIAAMYAHLLAQGKLHDRAALSAVARFVTQQMRRDDTPARWYLDKNPLNFRYLDFIAALFPQAAIIHCRRNLRDTALSLWSQHFAHEDLGFSYDFTDIAQFARGHDDLMAHWRAVLELPILDLEYEALATDPRSAIDNVTRALGMPEPSAEVDETSSPRMIATASVWQARQPVYTSSIGRWKRYAAYVPELEALFRQ